MSVSVRESVLGALTAVLTVTASACGGASDLESVARHLTAIEMGITFSMPDVELTSHTGGPYNLREGTTGIHTLLFFGFTHCPDICPITMSVVNQAFMQLTEEEKAQVQALFITVDPANDTVEQLAEWLGAVAPDAVGVTGTLAEIKSVMNATGLTPPPASAPMDHEAETDSGEEDSGEEMDHGDETDHADGMEESSMLGHPASLFVLTPDGHGRFLYGYGRVAAEEIVEDLRRLLEVVW